MSSLVEMTGAFAQRLFVPAAVLKSQDENQALLEARAQKLNANAPDVIAKATRTGVMTDGQARQSMQSMNSSLFLSGNRDRELGEEVLTIVKESAAKAPSVLADAVHGGVNKIGATIWRAVPWWIWAAIGVYIAIQLAVFVKTMRST